MASPGEDVQAWSTTAATNATADPLINWAEGQPRASVNNSARSQMAAHAKKRNLENGSITTGGAANAQTFTSGVGYTTPIPTGLWVRLKAGFTNTGAVTLNMDGIGAVAIKDQFGLDPGAGALTTGQYVELLYNGTNWILLRQNAGGGTVPQCGRLIFVSATALSFAPYNGDQIKINGVFYSIPAAGIAGLANTGVFVGGVAAQNLVANGDYNVYAFNNSGVITADFVGSVGTPHATSTTAGNVGTEIKSSDDSRTLIGKVTTNAAAQFENLATSRLVISWFNRRSIGVISNVSNSNTTSTTTIELSTAWRAKFLTWGIDDLPVVIAGYGRNTVAGQFIIANIGLDGATPILPPLIASSDNAGSNRIIGAGGMAILSEGVHFITLLGAVSGATGEFFCNCSAVIRG